MRYDRNILHDERSALVQLKIETNIEVLIIHSTHFPSKRTYVDGPRARGGGEIENSKSLVWHVHTQRTRRMARTAKSLHGRPAHAGV